MMLTGSFGLVEGLLMTRERPPDADSLSVAITMRSPYMSTLRIRTVASTCMATTSQSKTQSLPQSSGKSDQEPGTKRSSRYLTNSSARCFGRLNSLRRLSDRGRGRCALGLRPNALRGRRRRFLVAVDDGSGELVADGAGVGVLVGGQLVWASRCW